MNKINKPIVFDYLNYREFLNDYYIYRKSFDLKFSYRVFNEELGLKSRSFLKMVIDGTKSLPERLRKDITTLFDMTLDEKKYFLILVKFNEEKNTKQQTLYLKELHKITRSASTKDIKGDFNKLISKWYFLAVKSFLASIDYIPTHKEISNKLRGLISPSEARESIELLIELKIIEEQNGRYNIIEKHLETNRDSISKCIRNYHTEVLDLSSKALSIIPIDDREYLSVTMDISNERIPFIKEQIKKFHKDLIRYIDLDKKSESVCQLNLQFFKLSSE